MLKYFVDTLETLLTAMLLIGGALGFAQAAYGKRGRIPALCGVLTGAVGACVLAYLKHATKLIEATMWNLWIFTVSVAALLLFWVFAAIAGKKRNLFAVLAGAMLGVIACGLLLNLLPDVLANPYTILRTEKSVLSTAFLLKTAGIVLGLLAAVLAGIAADQVFRRLKQGQGAAVLSAALLVNALWQSANIIRILRTKRILITKDSPFYHASFEIIKFTSNHANVFTFGILAVLAIAPVLLVIRSLREKEPYRNPAEHRKIRRRKIVSRRWSALAVCLLIFGAVDITALKAVTSKAVDLAPVEEAQIVDLSFHIPFEQVADGHLHRFAYITEDNVEIRFIVIKKPNSSAYGIGLDACDICGETGYYEKDGQVVCKLCDVVMNINTIGFKGGCNPIVIPYTIENGEIVVPISGLLDHKKEFHS